MIQINISSGYLIASFMMIMMIMIMMMMMTMMMVMVKKTTMSVTKIHDHES